MFDRPDKPEPIASPAPGQKHRESVPEKRTHPGAENLRPPWKKGESGNPGGRPKGPSPTHRMAKILAMSPKQLTKHLKSDNADNLDRALAGIMSQMTKGAPQGVAMMKEMMARLDGPVTQKLEHAGIASVADISKRIEENREKAKADEARYGPRPDRNSNN